jgi:hypothetical protein
MSKQIVYCILSLTVLPLLGIGLFTLLYLISR